jgi:hypothetical protein
MSFGALTVHQPNPPRFAVQGFAAVQKAAQRCLLRRVASHHFVCERKSRRRHYQRDYYLLAVWSLVAAVAAGFGILFGFSLHVCACEQILLMLPHPIQTPVQSVFSATAKS